MNNAAKLKFWYVAIAVIAIVLMQQFLRQATMTEQLSYSEFERQVAQKTIAKVTVTDRHILGTYKAPHAGKTQFVTGRVDLEAALAQQLREAGVDVTGGEESNLLTNLLSWIVPALVFFGIWFFLYRGFAERMGMGSGGLMSIGKSRAKIYVEKDT